MKDVNVYVQFIRCFLYFLGIQKLALFANVLITAFSHEMTAPRVDAQPIICWKASKRDAHILELCES